MRHLGGASAAAIVLATCLGKALAADADADLEWLRKIQDAPKTVSYSGVFVYQQGQSVQSSRIVHVVDGSGARERLQVLDGSPREVLRTNDEVRCLLLESKTVLLERREQRGPFPTMSGFTPQQIAAYYAVRQAGHGRVAELDADIVELVPRDSLRYGYRIWVDKASGLLLKSQTLNERDEVVEQIAFSEIKIGAAVDRTLLKSRWSTEGWKVEDMASAPAPLMNWKVASPVAGFRKVQEMRRSMPGQADVGQFVFSDGLAAVSIFIEPVRVGRSGREAAATQGAVNLLSRRQGEYVVTVLGEVPAASIRQFAAAVEYVPSESKPSEAKR